MERGLDCWLRLPEPHLWEEAWGVLAEAFLHSNFFLPLFRSQVGVSACPGQEQAGYLNLGLKITAPQY